jgi:hypothetical protein
MKDDLAQIDEALRQKLSIRSVTALEGFPCGSYRDFVERAKNGSLEILTAFNPSAVPCLGSSGERAMYYVLTWSPALVSAVLVILAIMMGEFWLLLGIPLAFLGFLLSTPAFMKSMGSVIAIAALVATVYAWFQGNRMTAIMIGAYLAANYLTSVARTQCDMIIREAIQRSEPVLIWLYLQRSVVLLPRAVERT